MKKATIENAARPKLSVTRNFPIEKPDSAAAFATCVPAGAEAVLWSCFHVKT